MSKIYEIYIRNSRDELGRYANWPINQKIALGNIGYYHGRKAKFEWTTTIEELGISISAGSPQALISELYTSKNSVSSDFIIGADTKPKAEFTFLKSASVATQGYEVGHQQLPIDRLKSELLNKIRAGLEWDYDSVIITEIWVASGFTTLISNTKNSSSIITANVMPPNRIFNIADTSLGLQVTRSKLMAYQGVAEQNVMPFFQIHRLTKDHKFKLYGLNTIFGFNFN